MVNGEMEGNNQLVWLGSQFKVLKIDNNQIDQHS